MTNPSVKSLLGQVYKSLLICLLSVVASGCVTSAPVSPPPAHFWPVAATALNPLDAEFDRAIKLAGEVVRSRPDDEPLTRDQIAAQVRWMSSPERRADLDALGSWPSFDVQPTNWTLYK